VDNIFREFLVPGAIYEIPLQRKFRHFMLDGMCTHYKKKEKKRRGRPHKDKKVTPSSQDRSPHLPSLPEQEEQVQVDTEAVEMQGLILTTIKHDASHKELVMRLQVVALEMEDLLNQTVGSRHRFV